MKRVLILISLLFLGLTIIELSSSFALFETSLDEEKDLKIAKWRIFVNNYDLNNTNNTFYVDDITYTNERNEVVNKFAPGVKGEFVLEIDPTMTDVSFLYQLKLDLSENNYEQIKIDKVEGIEGTVLNYQDGVYSRVVSINDINNKVVDKIKVTFSWINDDKYNESDSLLGLNKDSVFSFPITIKFSQYKG